MKDSNQNSRTALYNIYNRLLHAALDGTDRECCVPKLMKTLDEIGFFEARCGRHHLFAGGTAQHCLEVALHAQRDPFASKVDRGSLLIVNLLHDVCDSRGRRDIGSGHHGERSVQLIKEVADFPLKKEESNAIRHHMHYLQKLVNCCNSVDELCFTMNNGIWHLQRFYDMMSTRKSKQGRSPDINDLQSLVEELSRSPKL